MYYKSLDQETSQKYQVLSEFDGTDVTSEWLEMRNNAPLFLAHWNNYNLENRFNTGFQTSELSTNLWITIT